MAKIVMMKHSNSGIIKKGYYGFSWTYFFFGYIVPIARREIKIAMLHLLLAIVTLGVSQIILSFLYNEQYMDRLIKKGYVFEDTNEVMDEAMLKLGYKMMKKDRT